MDRIPVRCEAADGKRVRDRLVLIRNEDLDTLLGALRAALEYVDAAEVVDPVIYTRYTHYIEPAAIIRKAAALLEASER